MAAAGTPPPRPRRRRKGAFASSGCVASAAAALLVAAAPPVFFVVSGFSLPFHPSSWNPPRLAEAFGSSERWAERDRIKDRIWGGALFSRGSTRGLASPSSSPLSSSLRMVAQLSAAESDTAAFDSNGRGGGPSSAARSSSSKKKRKKNQRGGGGGGRGGGSKNKGGGDGNGGKKRRVRDLFREAKDLERHGSWREASGVLRRIVDDIDPYDAHSHLALARLEARREGLRGRGGRERGGGGGNKKRRGDGEGDEDADAAGAAGAGAGAGSARAAFARGTSLRPDSVHLWQAWALHEQSRGDDVRARELFERALQLDGRNPYVCHAYGLMELRLGDPGRARELWERALGEDEGGEGGGKIDGAGKEKKRKGRSTAALVCSLGELHVSEGRHGAARDLYARHVLLLESERELTEVYLAAAWLEERHFRDMDRAADLLGRALRLSPGNSRAQIALARLEGRRATRDGRTEEDRTQEVRKRLVEACTTSRIGAEGRGSSVNDGRLFNAWAKLEVRAGRLDMARRILRRGMHLFPKDHSLLQAAGKVEERFGNYAGARDLYSRSLTVEPSAPTLVAYALLELSHPEQCSVDDDEGDGTSMSAGNDAPAAGVGGCRPDTRKALSLFEESLLLDPRHGPAYNAYGNALLRLGRSDDARDVYERGVAARCRDPASVHHGLARLELSQGNVDRARDVLRRGLVEVRRLEAVVDNRKRGRAAFLAHTLGMLELNSGRVRAAREAFEDGLERHGNSSQLLLGAALCEVRLGNDVAARKLFGDAVHADRRHAQAWQAWGVMEMRAGHYKTAKTLFECGIKSRPDHGALWQAYGTMESRRGNFDVARTLFAAGVEKCPNHVPLYQAWACLELRGRDYDRARVLIGEALTRDKEHGSGWLVAAKIEERDGNDGVAGLILRRGLERDPNNAELYRAVAELEIKRGRIDDARKLLERGLDADPLHAPSYHTLAELEARVFNVEGLARLNKRAAKVFSADALAAPPPPSSAAEDAWGRKIRASRPNARLPDGVAALVEEMGGLDLDLEHSLTAMDPDSVIEGMHGIDGDALGGGDASQ